MAGILSTPSPVQGGMLSGGGQQQKRRSILDRMGVDVGSPQMQTSLAFANNIITSGTPRSPFEGVAEASQNAQMMQAREMEMEQAREARQMEQQQRNMTREVLQREAPDLLPLVDAGQTQMAWQQYTARKFPKASDPFTLGEGEVRYDGSGRQIAQGPGGDPNAPNMDVEGDLRGEYQGQQAYKDYVQQEQAYQRVLDSATEASPAGDLALIFNYMKVLDPGSVVRESEFATAARSGSFGDQIQSAVEQVVSGRRLTGQQRRDFVKRAGDLFGGASQLYGSMNERYTGLATQYGVDPSRVVRPGAQIGVSNPDWSLDSHLGGASPRTTSTGVNWSM